MILLKEKILDSLLNKHEIIVDDDHEQIRIHGNYIALTKVVKELKKERKQ